MSLGRKAKRTRRASARYGYDLKMSEVLVDVALPLLRELADTDDPETYAITMKLAAALWNATGVPGEGARAKALTELKTAFGESAPPELDGLFRQVMQRADRLYPGLDRMIAKVETVPLSDGQLTVRVASLG